MEKQKVFWVVLAVSVFVVVVLIVGVLLLRQHPGSAPRATVTPMNDSGTQVFEYQRPAPQTQGTGPQAGTQPGSPSGDQQTMHFYIGEGSPPSGGTAGAPPAGQAPAGQAPGTQAPASPLAPVTAPAAPLAPVSAPAVQAARPRTTKPVIATRPAKKTAEYWIQTGSYKSQSKAEELVTLLEGKGLGSRMFSYNSKNDTFYRVRVGPYTNKGEADKFLALVKKVQGLETSYVSMVPAKSSVN
jgi:cell division protein FtsN